jgi:uncharacterized protein
MSKYLFILLILGLVFYGLGARRTRERERDAAPAPKPKSPAAPVPPQSMLACAECGVHLPAQDALPGRGGQFCCAAHRTAFEARHPAGE